AEIQLVIKMRESQCGSQEKVVDRCLELGLISFWFLSSPNSFRLSPPLCITKEEIQQAAAIIIRAIEESR
ncbi:MAG: aspartate aminotransferase family protein, partial [Crocinitomicaceae bacterium]